MILIILLGALINWPYQNFQEFLAQGDHGRDLYAAQAVLRGELPYKDFWWVYGPIMPFYYGLFLKIFGMQIPSVLLGKIVLNIASGAFFYLAFSRIFPAVTAGAAALWFMTFHSDFFFTYNHAGGIALMLAAVWAHCGYIKTARLNYAWGALAAVFVLGLIKINFALTTLLMSVAVVAAVDYTHRIRFSLSKKLFYAGALLCLPLAWFGVYAFFLHGLSLTEVRQCLPYLGGDEPYNHMGPLQTLPILAKTIFHNITSSWVNAALCGLVLLCTGRTLYVLAVKKSTDNVKIALLLGYLALFYILNLHEFLKSGVFYRSFWAQPLSIFLMFAVIASATIDLKRWARILLWMSVGLVMVLSNFSNYQRINAYKNGQHFLGGSRGQVYITNDRSWIQTAVLTTRQLQTTLKDDETFFALPYDCLYYYLTSKKSPTRQLIFFDHINITPEQEHKILTELEAKHTGFVLVSSRQSAREHGLGTLGVTYCPFISQYINTKFFAIAKIGDWINEPGWAWNHGTLIFKKQ